ncbi:nuclease-related domain-containing protein [Agromyces allii]|uniref:NERD domain-containing protein n=1 Tax=Agromyces allii TaxID=393607 RepID=A0ABP5BAJ8_9MICO|nr:nuclease-related domain-containing protein [Agromyces allii]
MTEPSPAAAVSLSDRPAAASVIAECLREQATAPPRSPLARVFGRTPLSSESQAWYLGAIGELEVARRLERLGTSWRVLHAVPVGRGSSDIDHVVIGPSGVFTLNTKHHEGKQVWVGSKRLLVNGQRTDHLRNAEYEANRAAQRLSRATGMPVAVAPVIVVVAARRITIREQPAKVLVVTESQLVGRLVKRPVAFAESDLDAITDAASRPATWHDAPDLEPVDLAAFEALRGEVAQARRRRRMWAAALLLGLIAASFVPLAVLLGSLGN